MILSVRNQHLLVSGKLSKFRVPFRPLIEYRKLLAHIVGVRTVISSRGALVGSLNVLLERGSCNLQHEYLVKKRQNLNKNMNLPTFKDYFLPGEKRPADQGSD